LKQEYLLIRNDVVTVKGYNRALVLDLTNGAFYFCPNSLCDFMEAQNKKAIPDIILDYPESEVGIVHDYIAWMLDHQLALLSCDIDFISNINYIASEWDSPHSITNCILEVGEQSLYSIDMLIQKIDDQRIPYIELRVFDEMGLDKLVLLLKKIQESDIKSVSVICKYLDEFKILQLRKMLKHLTVIEHILIFGAPLTKKYSIHDGITEVNYVKDILSNACCGNIRPADFRVNRLLFSESLQHNTCLNRKIAIDINGAIKNCPSMTTSFGNINNTAIEVVIALENFKKLWHVTKDSIKICKDCEFRHVCTDCRAYIQEPKDILSKPLKCGYSPYTNTWETWTLNPLSKMAIEHYQIS
jgi:SPASM domain peptide maturase of grasp-with-spasm system